MIVYPTIYQLTIFCISILIPLIALRIPFQIYGQSLSSIVKEIFRDLRLLRIFHYVALAALGMALYLREGEHLTEYFHSEKILHFPIFIICLVYSAIFAIVTNNIMDFDADKITNPLRPFVLGKLNRNAYLTAGIFCLVIALLLAIIVQVEMFFAILAISAGYFLYSCKPFRLKRVPFISKLIIGLNSLMVSVYGFILAGGKLNEFPIAWGIFILVPLSLSANFVDLKDTEGDRHAGIATLPVLFGEKNAKILITFFTIITYGMAGILLNITWIYPLNFGMALLHIWFLFRRPYNEKLVFMVYLASLVGLDVFLIFG